MAPDQSMFVDPKLVYGLQLAVDCQIPKGSIETTINQVRPGHHGHMQLHITKFRSRNSKTTLSIITAHLHAL